jgi:hypothetical protein
MIKRKYFVARAMLGIAVVLLLAGSAFAQESGEPAPPPAASVATETKNSGETSTPAPQARVPANCKRVITADVVAISQPYMLNRLGASMPNGLIFALKRDVIQSGDSYQLRSYKRARPIVLRASEGDCLQINFTNLVKPYQSGSSTVPTTTQISIHAQGMQLVKNQGNQSINNDGTFAGANNTSLAGLGQTETYTVLAEKEGTYLLYTTGDTATSGQQLGEGLFGAINVQPAGVETATNRAWQSEWYRSQITREDLELAIDRTKGNNGLTPLGQPIINYDALYPANYDATHAGANRSCTPILKMVDFQYAPDPGGRCQRVANSPLTTYHSDLTAIITGPNHGRFPGTTGVNNPEPPCSAASNPNSKVDPLFCENPASPDRKQPYREVTIIYHEVNSSAQAFPVFDRNSSLFNTVASGMDSFAINYGTGGIGAEIYANRIGVGPMGSCVDCKYEEFFLSSWTVGDPAMLVDKPANATASSSPASPPPTPGQTTPCTQADIDAGKDGCAGKKVRTDPPKEFPYTMEGVRKAQVSFYSDDPSNVYHSYVNEHVKFRILHGGIGVTHVHHQHAHQWLQSPNSDNGSYLDSQMISPGASYTLEMVYNGSGNRNKTTGDSIFHCHFYPHFAGGMWAMWRVHDVMEIGTPVCSKGKPAGCEGLPDGVPVPGQRALPDGEIAYGSPIPALVPLPTLPMALMPSSVFIRNGQIVFGTLQNPDQTGDRVTVNPGYPFYIPGIAGSRAPHPPLDFAPDGKGGLLDGGLPRHVNLGGSISNEKHTQFDWSKDFATLNSRQLPEDGTNVEKVAIKYNSTRCNLSFLPDGSSNNPLGPKMYPECPSPTRAFFILNGLPNGPQLGAPFADPNVDNNGKPSATNKRIYKAAAFQLDVTLNFLGTAQQGVPRATGWHYPQQRILSLWEDVQPTLNYSPTTGAGRQPEPLFIRGNSKRDVIEYWHTNLVPNYYLVDDFQVRTPTDIIGQHIHLVKFDVLASDGAANGFNYEDGTFSPDEVREAIHAINEVCDPPGSSNCGMIGLDGKRRKLAPTPPPAGIIDCSLPANASLCKQWTGAQTTVQRWWVDPLLNNNQVDRTLRTVFTHDHFGPSTHQQAGLYAGVLAEPEDAVWRNSQTGQVMGGANVPPVRPDGGPTSWMVDIITGKNGADSYREFSLEFQDFQLAYGTAFKPPTPYPNPDPSIGYRDKPNAINPPSTPSLISSAPAPGTQTLNYRNEFLRNRFAFDPSSPPKLVGDLSRAFDSTYVRLSGLPPNGDPMTPLLKTYQNDKVQIRLLVGAHMFAHYFTIHGIKWFAEAGTPQDPKAINNSGYRSSQAMGISEHFELLFTAPTTSIPSKPCPDGSPNACVDYLYSPSYDDTGLYNGMWGLFRTYDPSKAMSNLQPLPNNPAMGKPSPTFAPCPANAFKRVFNVTAVTAQKALADRSPVQGSNPPVGQLVFNSRGAGTGDPSTILRNRLAMMYVRSEDLDSQGKLKPGVPIEPLILRANAGDCIEVNLTNAMDPNSDVFSQNFNLPSPDPTLVANPSKYVGLSPQLLSYDATKSNGLNVGYNTDKQTAAPGEKVTYRWYAGKVDRNADGTFKYTPVEFGSLNLFPADPLLQHINALFGAMVVEPLGSRWLCGEEGRLASCDPPLPGQNVPYPPTTRASATVTPGAIRIPARPFREFVAMISDDLKISFSNTSAINYRTEPTSYRFGNPTPGSGFASNGDNNCAQSNALVQASGQSTLQADPQTPVFTAKVGTDFRFRLMHPPGTGTSQVFTLSGHVWQRNPYMNFSAQIGNNNQSQWIGSRDNHGATDHFDLVGGVAGGRSGVAGDYLYTVFLPNQAALGAWGLFRVLDATGKPVVGNPSCTQGPVLRPAPLAAPLPVNRLDQFVRQPTNKDKQ